MLRDAKCGLHGTEYAFGDVQTVPENGFNGTSTDSGNGGRGGRKSDVQSMKQRMNLLNRLMIILT